MVEEMAPLTILEAFAANLPIIGTRENAMLDQINEGYNGLLFEYKNKNSLLRVLKYVINNPQVLQEMKKNIQPPSPFETVTNATIRYYRNEINNIHIN